jgi:hypothetical protein
MIRFFFLFAVVFITVSLSAKEKNNSIQLGVGGQQLRINDQGPSALYYKGVVPALQIGYHEQTSKWRDELHLGYYSGRLKNSTEIQQEISSFAFEFAWTRLWKTNFPTKAIGFLGFQWHNQYVLNSWDFFPNNPDYYSIHLSLGPAVHLEKTIHFDEMEDGITFYSGLSASLLAYFYRPSIASVALISPQGDAAENYSDSVIKGRFSTLPGFQLYTTKLGCTLPELGQWKFSMEYTWKYLTVQYDNSYHEIHHQIQILTIFTF